MSNLKDVSKMANVTVSTVSRYLSGELKVRKDTEERILYAIKELDYRPNYIARALKMKQTHTVGVIVPQSTNPLFAEIVAGIYSVLSENNYAYIQMSSENDLKREESCFSLMLEKQVDGLITIGSASTEDPFVHWQRIYQQHNIPMTFINRLYDHGNLVGVRADFEGGACQAVEHLLSRGRKKIGLISGIPGLEESQIKERGYFRGLEKHGICADRALIVSGFYHYDEGKYAAERLFKEQKPDAILAMNDLSAIGALSCAHKMGLRVPEDVAIIGYGNSEASAFTTPALTTIDQEKILSGQSGARMLLQMIEGKPVASETIATKLILRDST